MKIKNIEKKFILRLVSVIVGLIIWVIIIYSEGSNFDTTLKGIPIQLSGEASMISNGLVVSNKADIENASISVRGKRSDIINSMGDITAVADVSQITSAGVYDIKISYELNTSAFYITEIKTSSVQVVAEEAVTKEYELEIVQKGESLSNDLIVESAAQKSKVIVEGAAADIEMIAHAAVFVDISDMVSDTVGDYSVKLLDDEFKELKFANNIYKGYETVKVSNILHRKATLPIKIDFSDEDKEKYVFEIEWVSEENMVVGLDEGVNISELKAIVKSDEYDSETKEYTAQWQIEKGVYMPSQENVKVKMKAIPIVEKEITVPLTVEADDNRKYIADSEVKLKVRGGESYISEENITAKVDIKNMDVGNHTIKVSVEFSNDSLSLAEEKYVTVIVQ